MHYVVGGLVAAFVIVLAVGAITGRVKARSCCAVADPARDLRMRAAFPSHGSEVVAGVGEVEALVAEWEVGDDGVREGDREGGPVEP